MSVIERPQTSFDADTHTYRIGGENVLGVSTIAKIGGAEKTWGVASAWGFRIGYEGAHDVISDMVCATLGSKDELRAKLKDAGLTPWSKRDKAAERGSWVHDILEQLAQTGEVASLSEDPEISGHQRAVYQWYLDFRPDFVATEVQVASKMHGFAGRYDIRCYLRCIPSFGPPVLPGNSGWLCLVDLKTSKGIYPETHFPQLAGYEGASVEMGFPQTDAQYVLNTHPDGTYDFQRSWATYDDFLAYLGALKAIRRIEYENPKAKLERAQHEAILGALPATASELVRDLPCLAELTSRQVGFMMSLLRKRGLVRREEPGIWHLEELPGAQS